MDEATKETLVERFRAYLDTVGPETDDSVEGDEGGDLHSLFVEMAALRTEVRTESRLVKDALDQFRDVFEPLRAGQAAMERDVQRARAETRDQARAILRPVLLDILAIRDRLLAGLDVPPPLRAPWYARFGRRVPDTDAAWREGLAMILRRVDRTLAERRVTPISTAGHPFDPRLARAVTTVSDAVLDDGTVASEIRGGFLWEDEVLRPAEVVVNKREGTTS